MNPYSRFDGLGDTIAQIRDELVRSSKIAQSDADGPLFRLESVSIEVRFVIKETESSEGGIDLKLVAIKDGDRLETENVHTVTLNLRVIDSVEFGVLHDEEEHAP